MNVPSIVAVTTTIIMIVTVPATATQGQTLVHGTVVASESGLPLAGATVTAGLRSSSTDRFGTFRAWIGQFPDSLTVRFAGRQTRVVTLSAAPQAPVLIELSLAPVLLPELTVTAEAGAELGSESVTRWQIPIEQARIVPFAIETDIVRAMTVVPAVSFSSPLSGRPLVRGYDSWDSGIRIDGFEVLSPYHIGRIFSALPADAVEYASTTAAPFRVRDGSATAGLIDLFGRVGSPGVLEGGAAVSLVSAVGWLGGGVSTVRGFGIGRSGYLKGLPISGLEEFPYDFQDAYGNATVYRDGLLKGRLTGFVSRDVLVHQATGRGMQWRNGLLASRWQFVSTQSVSFEVQASASTFAEDVFQGPVQGDVIDVRNQFERFGVGGELTFRQSTFQVTLGVEPAWRRVSNSIQPHAGPLTAIDARDVDIRRGEVGAYAEWSQWLGRTAASAGIRLDAAGANAVWQPRVRVEVPLSQRVVGNFAIGRTARLHHSVSDPQPEPELLFFDFWLPAGEEGIPVPIVDHVTAELQVGGGTVGGRASIYASSGDGLAELRPRWDVRTEPDPNFRFGESRTFGLEAQVALGGGGSQSSSVSVSYVLQWSQRRWDDRWVPWSQDRRHRARIHANAMLGSHWSLFSYFEAASPMPFTPMAQVAALATVNPALPGLTRDTVQPPAIALLGPENSARGGATAHLDVGASFRFSGPWDSQVTLGASALNLTYGPVAPLSPTDPWFSSVHALVPIRYERRFKIPPVPTVSLRIEF